MKNIYTIIKECMCEKPEKYDFEPIKAKIKPETSSEEINRKLDRIIELLEKMEK